MERPDGTGRTLVPFGAELLPAVQPWSEHPGVRRRLGGPQWPARRLSLLRASVEGTLCSLLRRAVEDVSDDGAPRRPSPAGP